MIVRKEDKMIMIDNDEPRKIEEESQVNNAVEIQGKDYFSSKEYGDTIKPEILQKLVSKEVFDKANASIEKYREVKKIKNKIANIGLPFLLIPAVSVPILAAFSLIGPGTTFIFLLILLFVCGVTIFGVDVLLKRKEESAYEEAENIEKENFVKDGKGKYVKAIWFLYHNLPFRDDEQKEAFLEENYEDLNYRFGISLEDYQGSGNYNEDYFEDMIKRNALDYIEEEENEEDEDYVRL